MWNTVLTQGLEAEIVSDMKLLEPELDSIHFLTSDGLGNDILVGRRNGGRRLPIAAPLATVCGGFSRSGSPSSGRQMASC